MSSMVPDSENGKSVHKRQSIDGEESSGHQQFSGDEGSSSKCMNSDTTCGISDLPDDVLQHILSYLPAKEVVRTCILSERWRKLWRVVPCLHAENTSESEDDEATSNSDDDEIASESEDDELFSNFVTCLLRGRSETAPLKVLSVRFSQSQDINYWISYAISHSVESLQIGYDPEREPSFILDGRTSFSSSHLRELVLYNFTVSETHLNQLNEHCPNLQTLKLKGCIINPSRISSRSLTSLYIRECTTDGDTQISAPNPTSLRFKDLEGLVVRLEKLPLLEEASVVMTYDTYFDDDTNWIMKSYKYQILEGLSHAKSIEINVPITEPLLSWKELPGGPLFSNLTTLVLGEWCMADLHPVEWFLQQAPLLENLHVTLKPVEPTEMEYEAAGVMEYDEPRFSPKERPLRAACLNKATIVCTTAGPMVQELINLLCSAAKSYLTIKIDPYE